jgi:hypothetical protein
VAVCCRDDRGTGGSPHDDGLALDQVIDWTYRRKCLVREDESAQVDAAEQIKRPGPGELLKPPLLVHG